MVLLVLIIFIYEKKIIYDSIVHAPRHGVIIMPTVAIEANHELSSLVIGIGEFSPNNIASDGDVHADATATDNDTNVTRICFI